jgi:hypothetical protein
VKKLPAGHGVISGLDVLARAAEKVSARGITKSAVFVLTEPPQALTQGEVLIAVADTKGVALKLVEVTAARTTEPLEELARRIAEIDLVAAELGPLTHPTASPPALTKEEESVLRSGGLQPDPLVADERHLVYRATAEYADLLRDCYSVEQAARLLSVNGSRIRQRLTSTPRTLYGIKVGKSWRIPRFQFQKRRLVPDIEAVVSRLAENLHPVAVSRWFTSPNSDLTVADERPVSPLEWLQSGNPPQAVADLAAEL